jgi:hypothetical protein
MNRFYKLSPVLIFIFGYFLWNNNSPLIMAGNALFVLLFILLLALIPAGIIYYQKKNHGKVKSNHPDILDDETNTGQSSSFYLLLSKFTFYVGMVICIALFIMIRSNSR